MSKSKLTDNATLENLVSSLESSSANFTYERVERLKEMAKELLDWRRRDLPTELDKSCAETKRLEDELIEERSLRLGRLGILEDPAFRLAIRGASVEVQVGVEMSVISRLDFIEILQYIARGEYHANRTTPSDSIPLPKSKACAQMASGTGT